MYDIIPDIHGHAGKLKTALSNLGYVEGFPQQGIAGTANDGVVCNWQAFGRNSPPAPGGEESPRP